MLEHCNTRIGIEAGTQESGGSTWLLAICTESTFIKSLPIRGVPLLTMKQIPGAVWSAPNIHPTTGIVEQDTNLTGG